VRAEDIPVYIETGFVKSDSMRQLGFPLIDRLEMATVTLSFYAIVHPWLPGKDGLRKRIPLAVISLAGLAIF
jgi:hypothetical protein